jgi:caffeoyl-CoA O-methyltransferase
MRGSRRGFLVAASAAAAGLGLSGPGLAQGSGKRGKIIAKEGPPLAKDPVEKRAIEVLDDIARNQSYYNVTREDGRLLRVFVESIGARRVIEIGTSTGYSGICIGMGLRAAGGRLTTFEIDTGRAAAAAENFRRAGFADIIDIVVGDAHIEIPKVEGTVDLVFIDADKEGYLHYLNSLLPKIRPGGLVIADNMRVPTPDPRFIEAITTNPALETLFLNMHDKGVGVTLKKG